MRGSKLIQKLLGTDDCQRYMTRCGAAWKHQDGYGFTTIPVLDFLKGLPLCNLILAYVQALHPSAVRIIEGEITTDAWPGRVTITVDRTKTVLSIEQEVAVGYGAGYEIDTIRESALLKKEPT